MSKRYTSDEYKGKGLFFKMGPCSFDPGQQQRVWIGRYIDKITNKPREVTLGRELSDQMDVDDAYIFLIAFKKGKAKSVTEKREERKEIEKEKQEEIEKVENESLKGLWKSYRNGTDKHEKLRKKKAIFKAEESYYHNHLKPHIGHIPPSDLGNADIKKLRAALQAKQPPLAAQTVKHIMSFLKRMMIDQDISSIPKFVMPEVPIPQKLQLTDEQVKPFLDVLETDTLNPEVCEMMLLIF